MTIIKILVYYHPPPPPSIVITPKNELVLDNGGDKLFTAIADVPVLAGTTKTIFTDARVITQLTTSRWLDDAKTIPDTTVHLWAGQTTPAVPLTSISYSINTTNPTNFIQFGQPLSTEGAVGSLVGMTKLQVDTARLSFQLWDDLISTTLVESGGAAANITLNFSSATDDNGTYSSELFYYNSVPGRSVIVADQIWINSNTAIWADNSDAGMVNGAYGFQTMMHEIGHSLGLSHPGRYNAAPGVNITYAADAVFAQDNREFTIMSYFGVYDTDPLVNAWTQDGTSYYALNQRYIYSQTPMVYDIAAIQALYGKDINTRTGDTIYGYNCSFVTDKNIYNFTSNATPIFTIYDAGGANDALDCSVWTGNQSIDLTPGSYSSVRGLNYNVGIAFDTYIEKAIGGAGNDMLTGNTAANTLIGNDGNDTLDGGLGADTLNGGTGLDAMIGGDGSDTYYVDNIGDFITETNAVLATGGTDTISSSISYSLVDTDGAGLNGGNVENLTLTGTALNGTGNALANSIVGNLGDNTLDGVGGIDTLNGGAGNDTYIVDSTTDIVTELATVGAGIDTVQSSVSYSLVDTDGAGVNGGNVENLALTGIANINATGNASNNVLIGNGGINSISGGLGNDTLDGAGGIDTLNGGTGNDIYIVDSTTDVVTEASTIVTEIDSVQSSAAYTLSINVENLTLTGIANINATGNASNNVLIGNEGINSISGGLGNDTLNGAGGIDTLNGGAGNDTYIVDSTSDIVTELSAGGTDTVSSSINYSLIDTDGAGANGGNIENLTLTGTALNGIGNGLANSIVGNAENNMLDGGTNIDTLNGGAGNDTYIVDTITDIITEAATVGAGIDTVQSSVSYSLIDTDGAGLNGGNVENLTLTGNAIINATGNALNNVLIGNLAANSITGGLGNDTLDGAGGLDTLNGGAGNDLYIVDSTTDVVTETSTVVTEIDSVQSSATFTLSANVENLTLIGIAAINATGNELNNILTGNGAANFLDGGSGADTLNGGDGDDTLFGGYSNNDILTGGAGNDVFIYGHQGSPTLITVTDFVSGFDRFSVMALAPNLTFTGVGGSLTASQFRLGTSALDADDFLIYDQARGNLYYDFDANGASSQIQTIDFTGVAPALSSTDIFG